MKKRHILLLFDGVLYIWQLDPVGWLIVLFSSSVSLLTFCLAVLSIAECGVAKSPGIIVDLSIFINLSLSSFYFEDLSFDVYTFSIVISSGGLILLALCNFSLCLILLALKSPYQSNALKKMFMWYVFFHTFAFNLPIAWCLK